MTSPRTPYAVIPGASSAAISVLPNAGRALSVLPALYRKFTGATSFDGPSSNHHHHHNPKRTRKNRYHSSAAGSDGRPRTAKQAHEDSLGQPLLGSDDDENDHDPDGDGGDGDTITEDGTNTNKIVNSGKMTITQGTAGDGQRKPTAFAVATGVPVAMGKGGGSYAPLPPPSRGGGGETYYGDDDSISECSFVQTRAMFDPNVPYSDIWAAVLFILHVLVIAALDVVFLNEPRALDKRIIFNRYSVLAVSVVTVFAFLVSFLWIQMTRCISRQMIWTANGVLIALYIVGAGLIFGTGSYWGFAYIGAALLQIVWLYTVRRRVLCASLILESVGQFLHQYPQALFVACFGLGLQFSYSIFFLYSMNVLLMHTNGYVVLVLLLCQYWAIEVINNIVHVAVAGMMGAYYCASTSPNGVPQNIASRSLGRALSTSFGSICFGSLVIALLNILSVVLRSVKGVFAKRRERVFEGLIWVCEFALNLVKRLIRYNNKYAFILIALYGYGYREAAYKAWSILKSRKMIAVINDQLIGNTIYIGVFMFSLFMSMIVGLWAYYHDYHQGFYLTVSVTAFWFTLSVCSCMMSVVTSSVSSFYVCFAADPLRLQQLNMDLYNHLKGARYPKLRRSLDEEEQSQSMELV